VSSILAGALAGSVPSHGHSCGPASVSGTSERNKCERQRRRDLRWAAGLRTPVSARKLAHIHSLALNRAGPHVPQGAHSGQLARCELSRNPSPESQASDQSLPAPCFA
jgi:hypothetical protein